MLYTQNARTHTLGHTHYITDSKILWEKVGQEKCVKVKKALSRGIVGKI